ncbi:endothelial lipase [Drosophila busckii]|uniref:endothelial lipase n=1 Tax=Drosophila busckii TaxID=30019 RepID=UPI00083EB09E|nr:endothelial lipase [Drosophila busckii]
MRAIRLILVFFIVVQLRRRIDASEPDEPECLVANDTDICTDKLLNFWLYRQDLKKGKQIKVGDDLSAELKGSRPMKILIHDMNGNRNSTPSEQLRSALLKLPDNNVLSLDFSPLAKEPCYTQLAQSTRYIGKCLGELLTSLVEKKLVDAPKLHLIGYGAGAHVAGFAANYLQNATKALVARISGLDPSKAFFLTKDINARLDASDADFVDVIHSDVFISGLLQPIGHVDFYPNQGVNQPNCGPIDELTTHNCYHQRSVEYYAESISTKTGFWGFHCSNLYDFTTNVCQPNSNVAELGYNVSIEARGSFFLKTAEKSPYARGKIYNDLDRGLKGKTFLPDKFLNQLRQMGNMTRGLSTFQ